MGDKFKYKYTAPTMEERREIDIIRNKYLPKEERVTKLERIRTLDRRVKNIPVIMGLSLGISGTLSFGAGLTFFIEWSNYWYIGIPFILIAIPLIILAYPIYYKLLKKYKEKYGDEIISIANDLLDEEDK